MMMIAMPVVTVAIMGTIVEVLISAVVTVITTTSNCMVNLDVPMDLQSYEIAYLIIKLHISYMQTLLVYSYCLAHARCRTSKL